MNEKTMGFQPNTQGSNQDIGTKVKEIKAETMVTSIERVNISEMGTTTVKTILTKITMVTGMIIVGPIFLTKLESFS